MKPETDIQKLANDLLAMNAKFTSEPFVGLPQKAMMTECQKCGSIAASVVCNVCGEKK